jgi:outer membrane protein assembly factor BamB
MIAVGSDDGTLYILNKYSGREEWSYSPGYYLFSSPVSSSPVVYGKTVYFATENGYIYALDSKKKEGPTSVFAYYIIAVVLVIAGAVIGLRKVAGRR